MDEFAWALIVSWHAYRGRVDDPLVVALCGRTIGTVHPRKAEMPTGKTCEVCLRGIARARGD